MGLLSLLSQLFGGSLIDNSSEETNIIFVGEEGGAEITQTDDGLEVNLAALSTDEREEVLLEAHSDWEEDAKEIGSESANEEAAAIETASQAEEIDDTLSFFLPLISETHTRILEAALHLREQWENQHMPTERMRDRRKDIAERFGEESYAILNLCSAGYFDEGRYLHELYREMRDEPDYREGDFRDAFEEIVEHQPFTVFVSGGQSVEEIQGEVRDKLERYKRYNVEVRFVDVRGIGYENRQKIEESIERLHDQLDGFHIKLVNDEPERVVRIDPETVGRDAA